MVRYRYRTTGEAFDHGEIRNFFNAQARSAGCGRRAPGRGVMVAPKELTGSQAGFRQTGNTKDNSEHEETNHCDRRRGTNQWRIARSRGGQRRRLLQELLRSTRRRCGTYLSGAAGLPARS